MTSSLLASIVDGVEAGAGSKSGNQVLAIRSVKGNEMTLRLGTETVSVNNYLLSGTKGQPEPEIGMGVTFLMWTDRHAGTIVSVKRFKSGERAGMVSEIGVKRDKAIRTDSNGMSEMQDYRFEPDPTSGTVICKRKKNGAFVSSCGTRVRIGDRDEYHDYSF